MGRIIEIKEIRPNKTVEDLAIVLRGLKGVEDVVVMPGYFKVGSKNPTRYLSLEGNNDSLSEAYTHICRAGYVLVSSKLNSRKTGETQ